MDEVPHPEAPARRMTRPLAITGVVLAGGQSRRMGGRDKGLVPLQGRPLIAHVLERLAPQVEEILVIANRNAAAYAAFGHRVLPDAVGNFAGPLAGLHRGLFEARHPLVLGVPCDCPALPHDLASRLLAALETTGAGLAVARSPERVQPVFCLCRRELLPALEAYLNAGGHRVESWQATCKRVEVAFDDAPEAFANVNSPEDLARAESSTRLP